MTRRRTTAGITLLALTLLTSLSTLAYAQTASLIYACVDPQGRLTIIAPGGTCGPKDRLITWPAESAGGVSYYQRSAASLLVDIPTTVVALCDTPEDTATGGGYWWERNPPILSSYTSCWVEATTSCRASGLCGGPAGEDGWGVMAWSCAHPIQAPTLHVYVTCSTSAE